MINLAIIEDDQTIRNNLETFIGFFEDLKLVLSCSSVEHFLDSVNQLETTLNCLLLDIGLPGLSGLEGLPKIKELLPKTDVIMLTTFEEEDKIINALKAGACSYLSKKTPLEEIINTIRIVHEGGSYMSPGIARKLTNYMLQGAPAKKDTFNLTPKQREVMECLVEGLSYQAIADKMFISKSTVKTHIKRIYEVLHVHSKAAAVARYLN